MGGQGLKMLMELKFLIIMARPHNITVACLLLKVIVADNSNVLEPGYHYQKFLIPSTAGGISAHFDFTTFSALPFLDF